MSLARFAGWSTTCASACKTSTTQNQPHQISNTQRAENKTPDVVIQQHSRKLLMMDTLMSETCWAHKKWNKLASDIKLVFHSSNTQSNTYTAYSFGNSARFRRSSGMWRCNVSCVVPDVRKQRSAFIFLVLLTLWRLKERTTFLCSIGNH